MNGWLILQTAGQAQIRQMIAAVQAELQAVQAANHQWQTQHAETARMLAAVQVQLQRATTAHEAQQPLSAQQPPGAPVLPRMTDLRGQSVTAMELAQALFPAVEPPVLTRSLPPSQPPSFALAIIILPLTFAPHSASILPEYVAAIETLGHVLTMPAYTSYRVRLVGRADSLEAKQAQGQTLSQARAENVRRYLVEHFAINPERVLVQGDGAREPRATNTTDEGRSQNRRVEVVNLGPMPTRE